MSVETIRILLVEDNRDFAKLVQVYLQRYERDRFAIVWKENHADAMAELAVNKDIDVVLMDYFLPGKNGLEITKEMLERKIRVPIVFLTVNKDFELALEVMRLGVADYLVKEEVSTPALPKTLLSVIERRRMREQLMSLEIREQRLRAIHEMLGRVLKEIETPLKEMRDIASEVQRPLSTDAQKNYLKIIEVNVNRLIDKLEKLKALKVDKTIQYIKDIRMIDLS